MTAATATDPGGRGVKAPRRQSTAWAWVLLVVLLIGSFALWFARRAAISDDAEVFFDEQTDVISGPGLDAAFAPYVTVVEQLADLSGRDEGLSREEFLDFVASDEAPTRLSPTYAILVTERVPNQELDEFAVRIAAFDPPEGGEPQPRPTIRGVDETASIQELILHAAPDSLRYNAIGISGSVFLDESVVDRGIEERVPALTPAVPQSVTETLGGTPPDPTAPDPNLGIIGMPYFEGEEDDIAGFVAVLVRLDLLAAEAGGAGQNGIGLEIFGESFFGDGDSVELLAETPQGAAAQRVSDGFSRTVDRDMLGQDWRLEFEELTSFPDVASTSEQWIWLGAGLLVSLLLFGMAFAQLRARNHALDMVDRATAELRVTAEELRVSEERFRNAFEDEKELAERLREADRLKAEFLSMASHELRTPLTAAAAFVDTVLLQWDRLDEEKRRELLTRASGNAKELTGLIDQLLASVRLDDERLDVTTSVQALHDLVDDVSRRIAPLLAHHHLEVDVPAGIRVMADPEAFRHVLTNLLTNAAKYSDAGTRIAVRAVTADKAVEVHVRDEGAGIAPEDVERVFERFYQVEASGGSRRGMGVGLAIVRRYVELQDGRIWVDSQPGVGSTFSFTLPLAAPEHATRDERESHDSEAPAGT